MSIELDYSDFSSTQKSHIYAGILLGRVKDIIHQGKLIDDLTGLPFAVDETNLEALVALLEKENTGLSLLTAGLLLEREIENFTDLSYKCEEDSAAYYQKRQHYAISFYLRAAERSSAFKPLISTMLWEIRTVDTGEARERLKPLDIEPSSTHFPALAFFKQAERGPVSAPTIRFRKMF